MTHKILAFIFAVAMGAAVPVTAVAETSIEIIDNEVQTVNVAVTESAIHVTGANGQVMHVYNVTGKRRTGQESGDQLAQRLLYRQSGQGGQENLHQVAYKEGLDGHR